MSSPPGLFQPDGESELGDLLAQPDVLVWVDIPRCDGNTAMVTRWASADRIGSIQPPAALRFRRSEVNDLLADLTVHSSQPAH